MVLENVFVPFVKPSATKVTAETKIMLLPGKQAFLPKAKVEGPGIKASQHLEIGSQYLQKEQYLFVASGVVVPRIVLEVPTGGILQNIPILNLNAFPVELKVGDIVAGVKTFRKERNVHVIAKRSPFETFWVPTSLKEHFAAAVGTNLETKSAHPLKIQRIKIWGIQLTVSLIRIQRFVLMIVIRLES